MSELLSVKGIGKAMLQTLSNNHITTINELINTLPSRYDIHSIDSIDAIKRNEKMTLKAIVTQSATVAYIRKSLTKLTVHLRSQDHDYKAVVFNREFLKNVLINGCEVVVSGRFESNDLVMIASDIQLAKTYQEGFIPIYRLEGVSDKVVSKLITQAMTMVPLDSVDFIPVDLREKRMLLPKDKVLCLAHHPSTLEEIDAVMRRLKYEELLQYGLKIAALKAERNRWRSIPKNYDIHLVRSFIATLPFELTDDQKEVTNDVFRDLKKPQPMLRLLQGDVGSGKTVCSMIAMFAVATAHQQVAFMAPTELLAYQHYQTFKPFFEAFNVALVYLSSSVKGAERRLILSQIETNKAAIIIGTHSLIQEAITYAALSFVVIDEQHRFGVEQRKALRLKGLTPDVLLMSATPIPRTLSMVLFGDMDISTITELPKGRIPIETHLRDMAYLPKLKAKLMAVIAEKHQAYLIVPAIEESKNASLITVNALYSTVKEWVGESNVEMLHGKMKSDEKTNRLMRFADNDFSILVATSVVEVGINAPNATLMVIMNADRFGLSQLHQLRGRIGRNQLKSECYLLSDYVVMGNHRLDILEQTTNGFTISEEDLRQRGPGEVLGEEQTGLPKLQSANIVDDYELLVMAFEDANELMKRNDTTTRKLIKHYQDSLENYQID